MKLFRSTRLRKATTIVACEVSQKLVTIAVPVHEPTEEQIANLDTHTTKRVRVPDNFFGRGVPVEGDALLLYPNGYTSWCPAKEFSEGFVEVAEGEEVELQFDEELKAQVEELTDINAALQIQATEQAAKLSKAEEEAATATAKVEELTKRLAELNMQPEETKAPDNDKASKPK